MEHEWEVRIRTPKGMDDVAIAVDPDTEEEARAVALFHIGRQGSPAYRLVYVRRHIVATSAQRRASLPGAEPEAGVVHEEYGEDGARHDMRAAEKQHRREVAKAKSPMPAERIGG